MTSDFDLAIIRRTYAKQVVHAAQAGDPRLERALAELRREDFLGPGPWGIMRGPGGYQITPDADPLYLYQDTPVSILQDKGLNNGQPSFLCRLIELCGLREGENVVHVGTGTGYFTAMLSRLVGASGHVSGIEYEPELAARATRNLEGFSNTRTIEGDGWSLPLAPADAILVNAGTPRPAATWLEALKPGGRLVLPLASQFVDEIGRTMTRGAIFLIVRDRDGYAASRKMGTAIYPCRGGSDPDAEAALAAAFKAGGADKVTRLRKEDAIDDRRCWLRGNGWSLTYD